MSASDRTQLLARNRMPGENRAVQLERVNHGEHVIAKPVSRVVAIDGFRCARGAETSSCDPVHVVSGRKISRKLVKDVCGVATPSEQDKRRSAAAPIEHLQRDICLD